MDEFHRLFTTSTVTTAAAFAATCMAVATTFATFFTFTCFTSTRLATPTFSTRNAFQLARDFGSCSRSWCSNRSGCGSSRRRLVLFRSKPRGDSVKIPASTARSFSGCIVFHDADDYYIMAIFYFFFISIV